MTYRPYPSAARARHQLDRHDGEFLPQHVEPPQPLTTAEALQRWSAAMRAAVPTARQLTEAWTEALSTQRLTRGKGASA